MQKSTRMVSVAHTCPLDPGSQCRCLCVRTGRHNTVAHARLLCCPYTRFHVGCRPKLACQPHLTCTIHQGAPCNNNNIGTKYTKRRNSLAQEFGGLATWSPPEG